MSLKRKFKKEAPTALKALAFSAILLAAVGTLGCAPPNSSIPSGQVGPALPGQSNANLPGNSVTQALLGTYTGTVYRRDEDAVTHQPIYVTQQYAFTLSSNQNQPYGRFVSNGPLGNLGFEGFLNMGLNGYPANNAYYYSFVSQLVNWPQVAPASAAIELLLALRANNGTFTVDLAQSTIRLLDCGFSQGGVCSNQVQEAGFYADLGKR